MIKIIIGVAVGFIVAAIVGLSIYLSPDDLRGCGGVPAAQAPCQTADAIVAVSGGDTTARAREAIQLYKNGWAPKLVFSGAAQDKSGPSNAAAMRREAQAAGVPTDDIILEEYSATTKQNAENTQSIFAEHNIKSVILVTSAYHQRRASLEFNARSDGVSVRNHPVPQDDQWSPLWWLTPVGWFLAVTELIKIIAFYLGGTR
ncbi:MAG TPA: YdcF family protein [Candidatus Saccharimonadales bacterium]